MLLSERNKSQRGTWELFKSPSLVETVRKATELGWSENKVQVRETQTGIYDFMYFIEPFEKDCGCNNILKFSEYERIEEILPLAMS